MTGTWSGGFQAEVTVTAGSTATTGWTVGWQLTAGQQITQSWGAAVTTAGSAVTATNASWNGTLPAAGTTTFGLIGTGTPGAPPLTCTAR